MSDGRDLTIGVKNILGVKAAALHLSASCNRVVIYGENVCGKTSLAKAIGAALSGHKQGNFLGLPASRRSIYCHNGAASASVEAEIGSGPEDGRTTLYRAVWEPTKGFSMEVGTPCIPALVAMEDILDWGPKEYADLFKGVKLDWAAFRAAFAQGLGYAADTDMSEVHANLAGMVYEQVGAIGIAAVHEQERTKAIERKRDWENAVATTGAHEKYGKRKAAEWRPAGWVPELEATSRETLVQELAAAEAELEEAKRQTHYDEATVLHLTETASRLEEYEKERDRLAAHSEAEGQRSERHQYDLDQKIKEVDKAAGEANIATAKCAPDAPPDALCPECGAELTITRDMMHSPESCRYTLEVYKRPERGDMTRLKAERDELVQRHKRLKDELGELRKKLAASTRDFDKHISVLQTYHERVRNAKEAQEKLAAHKPSAETVPDMEKLRNTVEHLRRQIVLRDAVRDAEEARLAVARHEQIMEVLKPQGPVDTALSNAGIESIKRMFDTISAKLGQDDLDINDCTVEVGGRPVQICSENERFMARLALMTAVALVLKQPVVVVDRLDVAVSPARREALRRFISEWKPKKTKLIFLVATVSRKEAEDFGAPAFKLSGGTLQLDG